jgi:amino acid adenylation domain-containing protein
MTPYPLFCSGNAAHMLVDTAHRLGDRTAVTEAGGTRVVGFDALCSDAAAIAAWLRDAGIRPGERAGIFLERGAACAAAYFGVLMSGGAAVIINEALKPRQIDYILRHSGARFLVSAGTLRARLDRGLPADVTSVDIDDPGRLPRGRDAGIAPRTDADIAHLIYTSGSTGMPKGVVVSHGNVRAGAAAVTEYLSITGQDRIASLLPFSFDYGLNQLLCSVATGATLVVERTPVPQRIVQALYGQEITVLPAVPPLWLQLLNVERFRTEPLPSLRVMTNTGGRVPTEAVRALRAGQPHADLVLMYGLTEAFRSTYLPPGLVDAKPDSIGRAIPGAEILVIRDDGTPCAPGEVGQLVHRGPTVTLGYWNDPDATAERFGPNPLRPEGTPDAERVVFSGDLVRMDAEGDLYFVGRRDSMIKSMGHRVAPEEVTDVLYSSGEIVEAVISTEPDEMRGDSIVAWVVLAGHGDLDRLKRYASSELPRYMQPVRYEVRDALPRTSSGKHDAKALSVQESAA